MIRVFFHNFLDISKKFYVEICQFHHNFILKVNKNNKCYIIVVAIVFLSNILSMIFTLLVISKMSRKLINNIETKLCEFSRTYIEHWRLFTSGEHPMPLSSSFILIGRNFDGDRRYWCAIFRFVCWTFILNIKIEEKTSYRKENVTVQNFW